jgi:hypothetical protein
MRQHLVEWPFASSKPVLMSQMGKLARASKRRVQITPSRAVIRYLYRYISEFCPVGKLRLRRCGFTPYKIGVHQNGAKFLDTFRCKNHISTRSEKPPGGDHFYILAHCMIAV